MSEIPLLSDALRQMRTAQHWKQEALARRLGMSPARLSSLEKGLEEPTRELVERAAVILRLPRDAVTWSCSLLEKFQAATERPSPAGDEAAARRERVRLAAEIGHWAEAGFLSLLDRLDRELVFYEDRRRAELLWERLSIEVPANRRALVRELPEYHLWALAELLWKKSFQAARDDAARAVELADLAVQVAERAPSDPKWQAALQAHAHAHHGNALRVLGDHAAAERAFALAREQWKRCGDACPELGGEARLLGFEASLRRDQRRFGEAEVLLRRALERDTGELTPHLLVNKAKLRRDQGDLEAAVEALLEAEPHLAHLDETEPRLVFAARSNLVDYLSLLERNEEAERQLPAVWRLAKTAAGELDRLRLVWVGGRVAAGTGRLGEGIAALEQVRSGFTARGMAYDAALAALELAVLHLEQGESARVHSLVREMLPVFQSREIHREALAALRLFQQAVEEERATAALVRQLVIYLHRARHNPELRLALQTAPGPAPAAGKDRQGHPSGSGRKGARKGGQ